MTYVVSGPKEDLFNLIVELLTYRKIRFNVDSLNIIFADEGDYQEQNIRCISTDIVNQDKNLYVANYGYGWFIFNELNSVDDDYMHEFKHKKPIKISSFRANVLRKIEKKENPLSISYFG